MIGIIQFEPIVGGETTLAVNLHEILSEEGEVEILHPYNKDRGISRLWKKAPGEFVEYDQLIDRLNEYEILLFLNSVHYPKEKELEKILSLFSNIENSKVIFYEHGFHTWNFCRYDLILPLVSKKNELRILTNTVESREDYLKKGYKVFLCRQPFNPKSYRPVKKNDTETINICFNSRFSKEKNILFVFSYFSEFFREESNFSVNFRYDKKSGLAALAENAKSMKNCKIENYAEDVGEIYDEQDFCLYFGCFDVKEMGKIEYSLLEAIYYQIPIIIHPFWFNFFKYEEYGFSREFIKSCFIELDPLTFHLELHIDHSEKTENALEILKEFYPSKIKERIQDCLDSFTSSDI
jgi:hypothetical protein